MDLKPLCTSSDCGVPFGVPALIGVESFGSNWWSPLFRIFKVEAFFTAIIYGGVFSLPVLEL